MSDIYEIDADTRCAHCAKNFRSDHEVIILDDPDLNEEDRYFHKECF